MATYRFVMTRTDIGGVTVEADTEEEAIAKATEYTRTIISVDNQSWHDHRIIKHNLVAVTEGE
jgi:hypothetical protein